MATTFKWIISQMNEYPNDDTLEKAIEIINNYQPE